MSSTNRLGERVEKDNYPTPYWALEAMLRHCPDSANGVVLDPACGDGRILLMSMSYGAIGGIGYDTRLEAVAETMTAPGVQAFELDALTVTDTSADVLNTNPPYSQTLPFIQHFVPLMGERPSQWLLPLSYLASIRRGAWVRLNMPYAMRILPARPCFIAVCQGVSETRSRAGRARCGAKYLKGTTGTCACGGAISDGVDSNDYAWFEYRGLGLTYTPLTEVLDIDGLDRSS